MADFVSRYYRYFLTGLITILMVLSFAIGREEGLRFRDQENVIISCTVPEEVTLETMPSLIPAALKEAQNITIATQQTMPAPENTPTAPTQTISQGKYMGSKNGTKYYTPGCSGSLRIKPENYIWFTDEEDATLQGYSKGSC
ncbi:hypothetical protein IT401_02560 [Candidatus Nomurabacteria bacterium]|nr:hypothetical protein [Candidatus Nomurabacteria bacterium]